MLQIAPPYREDQLREFARTIDTEPPPGYPPLGRRFFLGKETIRRTLKKGRIFAIPEGHDAVNSSPHATIDEEILTGHRRCLPDRRIETFTAQDYITDQHGRPIHPGAAQLLNLRTNSGDRLGMPTGIGKFKCYGRNGLAYGIVFRKNTATEEILLIHSNDGWGIPGGPEGSQDCIQGKDPALFCAARAIYEATGIDIKGLGKIIASMIRVNKFDTLNAWRETFGVAFIDENEQAMHDITLEAGGNIDDIRWFPALNVLSGDIALYSIDHERYIAEAVEARLAHKSY